MNIRVARSWKVPGHNELRQTPDYKGLWGDVRFTFDEIRDCDYFIATNHLIDDAQLLIDRNNIWCVLMEPPVKEYNWFRKGYKDFAKIFTQETDLKGEKFIHTQGGIFWLVNKDYDFLKQVKAGEKNKTLSWITSAVKGRAGHRDRMSFLDKIKGKVDFDLYGRGFTEIKDKWDGLYPYKYAISVENHSGEYYWSEKIADCFLSWTMPLYYGCTNISDYFPKESYVQIDIKDEKVADHINEIIKSDLYLKNREAIEHARNLVLDKYQFFPLMESFIREDKKNKTNKNKEEINLKKLKNPKHNLLFFLVKKAKSIFK